MCAYDLRTDANAAINTLAAVGDYTAFDKVHHGVTKDFSMHTQIFHAVQMQHGGAIESSDANLNCCAVLKQFGEVSADRLVFFIARIGIDDGLGKRNAFTLYDHIELGNVHDVGAENER